MERIAAGIEQLNIKTKDVVDHTKDIKDTNKQVADEAKKPIHVEVKQPEPKPNETREPATVIPQEPPRVVKPIIDVNKK